MPKSDGAASSDVKPEPYPKQSPKKERSQKTAWTDEMDKIMINHILSNANITFNYDWPALQKLLPGLTVTQVRMAVCYIWATGLISSSLLARQSL